MAAEGSRPIDDGGLSAYDRLEQARIFFRIVLEVGVLDEYHFPAGVTKGSADRAAFATVKAVADGADARVGFGPSSHHVPRTIGGAVVY